VYQALGWLQGNTTRARELENKKTSNAQKALLSTTIVQNTANRRLTKKEHTGGGSKRSIETEQHRHGKVTQKKNCRGEKAGDYQYYW